MVVVEVVSLYFILSFSTFAYRIRTLAYKITAISIKFASLWKFCAENRGYIAFSMRNIY